MTVLAGGTDVYPAKAYRDAWGDPRDPDILDISKLTECRSIDDCGDHFRIGALTTWTDTVRATLPSAFDGLKEAAYEIGGVQIQNRGTLAGNLCNASPAADGVPVLLTLDASVELSSARGQRVLPLAEFITDYRQTACAGSELLTGIHIPKPREHARSRFLKLGARRYMVISIVMAAGLIEVDSGGRITDLRVAIGACSPIAQRLHRLEARARGTPVVADSLPVQPEDFAILAAIDDCRATRSYRDNAALILTQRLLQDLRASVVGEGVGAR